jgi:hypothetical protein
MAVAISISFLLSSVNQAIAVETVMDGIAPQSNASMGTYFGLSTQNYGFGFVAGESREIVEIDILVSAALTAGKVAGYLYQNSNNGISGSGTYVATFTQATTATSNPGITNSYLLRLTGSAQVTSGLKYWVYFRAPVYSGNELHGFATTTPTVTGSWAMVKSGASFLISNSTNNFAFDSFPTFKIILSTPTTISVSLNAGGNSSIYRTATTIKAMVNSNGPVAFYANGKVIPGCKRVESVSLVALCSWKPSIHAGSSLTARVTPTDSANYSPKTSLPFFVGTDKRTTKR